MPSDVGTNTHLGLGWRERLLQAQLFTSAEWYAAIAGGAPLILLGDFNSLPGSRPYRALTRYLRDGRCGDPGFDAIVGRIIGFCLIRQSSAIPIVCFHSKPI